MDPIMKDIYKNNITTEKEPWIIKVLSAAWKPV